MKYQHTLKKPIPITVITGFLGSGKTTLLSALLKQKEMANAAVIINEFGEIGLDHAFIESGDENMVELQSGCICCTIRGDLNKTLLDLANKAAQGTIRAFDRVAIETTGLADPAPIVHTLMTSSELQQFYTLDGLITLVDAVNGEHTLDTQQESVKQAALAERIILSKTDLADDKTQQSLIKRLKAINPTVEIMLSHHGDLSGSVLFGLGSYNPYDKSQDVKDWLAAEQYQADHHHDSHHHDDAHGHHHHDVNRHGDDIQAFSMAIEQPVDTVAFSLFLDLLSNHVGPDLLRIKGIINILGENRPVIHGVQHHFHPVQWLDAWPDEDTRTRLVFITRHIQKEQVTGFFHALMGKLEEKATST